MDDKTLAALNQSIEKWERNAVAETPDDFTTSPRACALCWLFWKRGCGGCPVMDATGKVYCHGTPCDEAFSARRVWSCDPASPALRDAAHAAARDEVAFLRSLLSAGEATP